MGPLNKKQPKDVLKAQQKLKKKAFKDKKQMALLAKIEKDKLIAEGKLDNFLKKDLSTLSIAVPGSILKNAQSVELRTYLAGQIARAICMFQVDEIIIFDDESENKTPSWKQQQDDEEEYNSKNACLQFGRILQYLECPQYLRKSFFPMHKDLRNAGLLNPLDAPHHLRTANIFEFREGVVIESPQKEKSFVNVGFQNDIEIDKVLEPGVRCTVRVNENKKSGTVVSPLTPRRETGVYWGYSVRIATSLWDIFSGCPFKNGYDLSIGTSDKGESVDTFEKDYSHCLIVFGGLFGIESALGSDGAKMENDPNKLFNYYLNTLPNQGSRTIRTEEAVLVTLSALRTKLKPQNPPMEFVLHDQIALSIDT